MRSNVWSVNVNDATDNEVPSKATAKLGHDLKILCDMDYNLTFFAWYFCQFNCLSQTADWQIVVKVDHGNITNLNPSKFDMDTDGSLIFKDIQPSNDHNWVRCFFTKHYVYTDHRSTIIRVVQGNYTELLNEVSYSDGGGGPWSSKTPEFHWSCGLFLWLCASRSLDFSQSCLGVSSFFKAKKVPRSRIVFRLWLICFYNY